jgi:DNA-binding CsgD family transcriptional regulator
MIEVLAGMDVEVFSAMVGSIYDAVLDRELWPQALLHIREFAIGQCATIFTKDVASHTGGVVYDDGGIAASYREGYFRSYVRLDPTFVAQYYSKIGEPMATEDFLPYDEFVASRFYREWAEPQELVDFAAVALEKSATSIAMFGVFRHRRHGLVDQSMRDRLRLVAPHVRRAVEIGRLIDRQQTKVTDLAAAFDGLASAVVLVDAGGGLRHANLAAHSLIDRGTILRVEHNRLTGATPEVSKLLSSLYGAGRSDLDLERNGINVPLGRDGDNELVLSALPLSGGRRAGSSRGAALALLVSPARPSQTLAPPELIARRYNLTPAELRILLTITEIGGIPATAEALGISRSTVKFHLKSLYLKTGVNRQAGLVKLLAHATGPA